MKKLKIKQDQISWRKIKLISSGANGIELNYCYIKEIQGRGFLIGNNFQYDIPPHDDLVKLFKQLRPIVAKIENIDYARKLPHIPGFNPTDIQLRLMEGLTQNTLEDLEVTGISISERKKSEGVIISYKKYDIKEQSTGHSTAWINMSGTEYGIEEDLIDIIIDIKSESFMYEFEDKYADFEQMSIDFDNEDEDEIDLDSDDENVTDVDFEEA